MRGISWLAGNGLASQDWLCSMEWVSVGLTHGHYFIWQLASLFTQNLSRSPLFQSAVSRGSRIAVQYISVITTFVPTVLKWRRCKWFPSTCRHTSHTPRTSHTSHTSHTFIASFASESYKIKHIMCKVNFFLVVFIAILSRSNMLFILKGAPKIKMARVEIRWTRRPQSPACCDVTTNTV